MAGNGWGCADSIARPKHLNPKQICLEGVRRSMLLASYFREDFVF